MTRNRLALTAAFTALALSALAGTSPAAVVTYPSDLPGSGQTIQNNQTRTSTATVPAGRPPATDIDVVQFNLSAPSNSNDQSFALRNPGGVERFLIVNPDSCSTYSGATFSLDQQSAVPFGSVGNCPPISGNVYRPSDVSSLTPLTDLLGPAGGTWTMTYDDAGASDPGGNDGIFGAWALRITHAPFDCTGSAAKQKLRKRLTLTVNCNGGATALTAGDAKAESFAIPSAQDFAFKAKLRKGPRNRLEDRGKANISAALSNDLGESDSVEVKIKIKR